MSPQTVTRLIRKIGHLITKGVISLVDDSTGIQTVQSKVLKNEVRDGLERPQDYGFTSVPKPGAEAVIAFPKGNRDLGIVLKVDDRRYRLKSLQEGEVALYDDLGSKVHLKRGGHIEIKSSAKVFIDCDNIELGQGSLEKIFKCETFQTFFNSHTHMGNLGGPTGAPIQQSDASHLSSVVKSKG